MQHFLEGLETGYDLKQFCEEEDDLSSCPCFLIERSGFRAKGSCWRTSYHYYDGTSCEHIGGQCCVHVWGDTKSAIKIKMLLDKMNWYGEWELVIEADKPEANF
jgi:hypothetical protein